MDILAIHSSGKTLYRDWRGEDIQTTWGILPRESITEAEWGKAVPVISSKDERFIVLKPLLRDRIQNAERGARPLYEYDTAIAAALMSLGKGMTLLEAGTGSGCATMLFAQLVDRVVSLEREERFYEVAKNNIEGAGIENVELRREDLFLAELGWGAFDAVFLDLKEDVKAIKKTVPALKRGGYMCVFSPVEAKVEGCVNAMKEEGFVNIELVQLGLKRRPADGKKLAPCFPGFFVVGRRF